MLYVFRDQHTTNDDNPKAQSIIPTVACIIDDLYSYCSQLESVIGHLQSPYAKDALSKMLNAPIHPCKVNVSGGARPMGNGQQVKDILNCFQGAQTVVHCTHTTSTVLQGKGRIRVMCETSSSPSEQIRSLRACPREHQYAISICRIDAAMSIHAVDNHSDENREKAQNCALLTKVVLR